MTIFHLLAIAHAQIIPLLYCLLWTHVVFFVSIYGGYNWLVFAIKLKIEVGKHVPLFAGVVSLYIAWLKQRKYWLNTRKTLQLLLSLMLHLLTLY